MLISGKKSFALCAAKWNVERERSSKYFCNLKKRHFTEKAIPKLILDNGFEITNQDDILTQQHIFYEALYARYFQDHFPFCPFPFFERRVRNSSTTNY
jgi:hypothetical protein